MGRPAPPTSRPPRAAGLSSPAAAALVFGASAAVLVLEILAVRMLAPYVGLTIETYTAIIGVVLAGIALGSAAGGRLADAVDPRRLLGPLLVVGGLLGMATVPIVEALGGTAGGRAADAVVLGLVAFLPPAAVLSAVTPTAAKLRLADVRRTGAVVGGLSAWATAGALVGTFAAGFVLVPLLATRTSVLLVGGTVVLAGLLLTVRLSGAARPVVAATSLLAVLLAAAATAAGSPCDAETTYHCARIVADDDRPGGRLLVLDDLHHSYVDVDDPRHLEFDYVRWIAAAAGGLRPEQPGLDAVFVGGGGFTLPRWLAATRPGSRSTVLEIDDRLVAFVRRRLGVPAPPAARVVVGDARVGLRRVPARSADLVVGDAFSSRSLPWHLATEQFARDVRRVLRADGVYALNVIDTGALRLARAEAATLRRVFPHVALIAEPGRGGVPAGGNLVLLASDRPLDLPAIADRLAAQGDIVSVLDARAVARLVGGAQPLTDDWAPADQLLGTR